MSFDESKFYIIEYIKKNHKAAISALPVLAIFYSIVVAIINVGFIARIGAWTAPLFSFPDFLQANFGIIRSILFYVGIWYMFELVFINAWRSINKDDISNRWQPIRWILFAGNVVLEAYRYMISREGWAGYFVTIWIVCAYLSTIFISKGNGIFLDMLPMALWIIVFGYMTSNNIAESGHISLGTTIFAVIAIGNFAFSLGYSWAENSIVSKENIVSITFDDNVCVYARLLRSVNGGMIIHNEFSNGIEFRKVDKIKVISHGRTCI